MSTTQEQYWSLAKTKKWLMNQIGVRTRARNITEMKTGIFSCLRHFPALDEEGKPRFNIDQRIKKTKYKSFSDALWYITLSGKVNMDAGGRWSYVATFITKDEMEGIPQTFETKKYTSVKYLKKVVVKRIIQNNKLKNVYSGYNISGNNIKENIGWM